MDQSKQEPRFGDAGLRLLFAIQEACPETGIASGILLGAEILLREYKKKVEESKAWEKAIRIFADDLYASGKKMRDQADTEESGRTLQAIATNLHRLCRIQKGQEPLPAAGERL